MCSELKKLTSICIVLLVVSILFSVYGYLLLTNTSDTFRSNHRAVFVICCYLIIVVPILLGVIIYLLKKLIEILGVIDSNLSERITEIKKSLK